VAVARFALSRLPFVGTVAGHALHGDGVLWGLVTTGGSFAFGAFLLRRRLPSFLAGPFDILRAVHSGHVGDYVAWLTLGAAVLGGVFALGLT